MVNQFSSAVLVFLMMSFAQAQQKLAYVKVGGKGNSPVFSIYLATEGAAGLSDQVLLYSATAGKAIHDIDVRPGGGQIAFGEAGQLKVLNYVVSGSSASVSVQTIDTGPGCWDLNYSNDGTRLAHRVSIDSADNAAIRVRDAETFAVLASNLMGKPDIRDMAFVGNDRLAYVTSGPQHMVRIANIAADGILSNDQLLVDTNREEFGGIEYLDSSRIHNSILVQGGCKSSSAGCGTINLYVFDATTGQIVNRFSGSTPLTQGSFNQDDSAIVHRQAANTKSSLSQYLVRRDANGLTRLSGRAEDVRHPDYVVAPVP